MKEEKKNKTRPFSTRRRLQGSETLLQTAALLFLLGAAVIACLHFFLTQSAPAARATLISAGGVAVLAMLSFFMQLGAAVLRREWVFLEDGASLDPVTGILTYAAFERLVGEETRRSGRYHFPLSLCILDLDDFRNYNEVHGRKKGDERLRQVAAFLRGRVRFVDCVARGQNDEFCLLLPHTDLLHAEKFLARLQAHTEELLDCSFAAGVTLYRAGETRAQFFMRAAAALSQARRQGKGKFRFVVSDHAAQAAF